MFIPWDGMGYSKKFCPIPWDDLQKPSIPSHPMGHIFFEKRPMGWDGMGWDGIIPSHAEPWFAPNHFDLKQTEKNKTEKPT